MGKSGAMRRISLILAAAAASLVAAAPASAQLAPGPKPIVTTIDKVPMVELYDGGGGLPYLGSSTSYNAGDWENALRTYAHNGDIDNSGYMSQIAQVDKVAQKTIDHVAHAAKVAKAKAARKANHGHGHGHGHGHHGQRTKKLAVVLDIDETQ